MHLPVVINSNNPDHGPAEAVTGDQHHAWPYVGRIAGLAQR